MKSIATVVVRLVFIAIFLPVARAQPAGLAVYALRCDAAENPLGIDSAPPRLSWKLRSDTRGARQTAWQVLVASSTENLARHSGDIWDSGIVKNDGQLGLAYGGRALRSAEHVFWQVRVWDGDGKPSAWSETSTWTMGVLAASDWHAQWITAAEPQPANATLRLRREFSVKPGLRRALVNACGLGQQELALNGHKIGDELLTPGWTDTVKTCLYDTHDITGLLRSGTNVFGLTLAGGMYSVPAPVGRYTKFTNQARALVAIAQLRLEYADGSVEIIGTDDRWQAAPGPTTYAHVFAGEDFDARLAAGEPEWRPVVVVPGPGGALRGSSHAAPALSAHETLTPVAVKELRPGVFVYDLGQNASIIPRLSVHGVAGAEVKIIPAELVKPDGSVDRGSVGGGNAWWRYTLNGRAEGESWFPSFFYHGSRYLQVELTAPAGAALPQVDALEGVVVHSASPTAGEFACSDDLFNRIHTLVRWAQRSNLVSVLTDCPHRERLGWLEQYHLNGPALRYEFDLTRLFAKTFDDMADAQTVEGLVPDIAPEFTVFSGGFRDSPEWGSAFILATWQHYIWTGDAAALRQHFDAMQHYVGYLAGKSKGQIVSHGLGDWYDLGPNRPGRAQLTPVPLTATAFYFEDAKTLATIARVIGRADDATRLDVQAAEIKAAFNREFFHADTGRYATGSQTANALPLVMGLAEPDQRSRVLDALVADVRQRGNAITAGDVGYRYLLRALADGGRSDVIFDLNHQSDKPGYGYQLAHGATSLTEAWNADPRSSQNHFMLGQINEWFYHDLVGLAPDPAAPGFKNILVRPQPVAGIEWARAAYDSPRGKILVAWRREAGQFVLQVEVPPNATASVFMPTPDSARITEGKVAAEKSPGVKRLRTEAGATVYAVLSGRYEFRAPVQ